MDSCHTFGQFILNGFLQPDRDHVAWLQFTLLIKSTWEDDIIKHYSLVVLITSMVFLIKWLPSVHWRKADIKLSPNPRCPFKELAHRNTLYCLSFINNYHTRSPFNEIAPKQPTFSRRWFILWFTKNIRSVSFYKG